MEAEVGIHWVGGYSRQRRGERSWRNEVGKNSIQSTWASKCRKVTEICKLI